MYYKPECGIVVLDYLRINISASLFDLIYEMYNKNCLNRDYDNLSILPKHTGRAIFSGTIRELALEEFIRFDDDEIHKAICLCHNGHEYHLGDFLESKMDRTVHLTDKLSKIQNLLNFSLTKVCEDLGDLGSKQFRLLVTPQWGSPKLSKGELDVFVIMPFAEEFTNIYNNHIYEVCKKLNFSCKRADDIFTPGMIINDIWNMIYAAKLIICDCTRKNPNVFYELGIAHTLGKQTIILTQNENDVPFDVRHLRYVKYTNSADELQIFDENLRKCIECTVF